jgi:hypothetical protein
VGDFLAGPEGVDVRALGIFFFRGNKKFQWGKLGDQIIKLNYST